MIYHGSSWHLPTPLPGPSLRFLLKLGLPHLKTLYLKGAVLDLSDAQLSVPQLMSGEVIHCH